MCSQLYLRSRTFTALKEQQDRAKADAKREAKERQNAERAAREKQEADERAAQLAEVRRLPERIPADPCAPHVEC